MLTSLLYAPINYPLTSLFAYTKLILRFHQCLGVFNLCPLVDTTTETLMPVDNHTNGWELAIHEIEVTNSKSQQFL